MVSFNNRKEAKVSRVLHPPKSCFHLSVFSVGNCQRFWSDAKAVLEQHEHLLLAHFSCRWGADFEKRSEFTLRKERKKRLRLEEHLDYARCRLLRIQGLLCQNTSLRLYQRDQKIGQRGMKGSREVALQVHFYPKKMQVNKRSGNLKKCKKSWANKYIWKNWKIFCLHPLRFLCKLNIFRFLTFLAIQ